MALHQQGRIAAAESIYLDLLRARADDVDALHYLGVLRMGQGRRDQAVEYLRRSLDLAPANAHAWNSFGNVMLAGKNDAGAEQAYLNATRLKSDYAEAFYNLGNLYRRLRRRDAAVSAFQAALDLNPRFAGAYENLAMLFKRMERDDLRGAALRRWLVAEPDNPIARHMAAAHSREATPARASDAFVTQVFDRFAGTFDESLANLHYAAPGLLSAALSEVIPFAERRLAILDAGCGTGLCGPLLRSSARSLVGVDLSPGMLVKAAERRVYDELHESELVAFMRAHPDSYDVIVSADTLNYFGALEDPFAAASGALRDGGVFAFTLEAAPAADAGFRLHDHGRYSHGERFVRECLAASGFHLVQLEAGALRKEGGEDVAGHIVLARKKV